MKKNKILSFGNDKLIIKLFNQLNNMLKYLKLKKSIWSSFIKTSQQIYLFENRIN